MYSQAGHGGERIRVAGGREGHATRGELVVLPAGIPHQVDVTGASELRRWVHVNYLLFNSLDLFSLLEVPLVVKGEIGAQVGAAIQEWVDAEAANPDEPALRRSARRHETGFKLLRLLAPVCRPRPEALERMERAHVFEPVIQHMRRHFGEALDRDTLAGLAGLSPAQFHVAFRKATGTTPVAFLKGHPPPARPAAAHHHGNAGEGDRAGLRLRGPVCVQQVLQARERLSPCEYRQRVRSGYRPPRRRLTGGWGMSMSGGHSCLTLHNNQLSPTIQGRGIGIEIDGERR